MFLGEKKAKDTKTNRKNKKSRKQSKKLLDERNSIRDSIPIFLKKELNISHSYSLLIKSQI